MTHSGGEEKELRSILLTVVQRLDASEHEPLLRLILSGASDT